MRARACVRLTLSILLEDGRRLALCLAGVGFAVLLVLVQLGFRSAITDSCTLPVRMLAADVVIQHRDRANMIEDRKIPRHLLARARAVDGVADASPLYMNYLPWRSREDGALRSLRVYGVEPLGIGFRGEGAEAIASLARPDTILYDRRSLSYHGPAVLGPGELGRRRVEVVGFASIGTSVFYDGSIITGAETFSKLRFLEQPAGARGRDLDRMDLGLVRVSEGRAPAEVAARLRAALAADDVLVLTREEMVARERAYIETHVPLAAMMALGVALGLFVGAVICYQILYTDIVDHAPQFATLKAMGYRRSDLFLVVGLEGAILGLAGYVPSLLCALVIYPLLEATTHYPFVLGPDRVAATLGLTVLTCLVSAALAVRRIAALDPAEVFR